jgi:two-component system, chemotaxis family, sensor kinase CheA
MDQLAEIRETFFQECDEQLVVLEAGLLQMESEDSSSEVVNSVFRAVHSIKGGAGAFKLASLVGFSHKFETVLDLIRSGKMAATPAVVRLLLKASDELSDLVAKAREGEADSEAYHSQVSAELEAMVESSTGESEDPDDSLADLAFQPITISVGGPTSDETDFHSVPSHYEIGFKPHASLYAKANEPLALLRCVGQLGTLQTVCDTSDVPLLHDYEVDGAYLSFSATLRADCTEFSVREIFDFVEGDCDLAINQVGAQSPSNVDPDELLRKITKTPLAAASTGTDLKQGLAIVPKPTTQTSLPTIRVELERVDRLINVVGELVINQAMLSQSIRHTASAKDPGVSLNLSEMAQLTREIQNSVMAIRAQPLKPLFQRMGRTIREVSEATGKQVRLQTDGEATEVDKTVVELLADPLTHMIRNAVDHGIESPQVRASSGKPPEGVVRLSAAHRSGRVIIQVSDDGAGINRQRVLSSAVSKGLVAADAQLSDGEIDNLLFLPGFSTASAVSNISGRGVGMDVVKKSIQALGGRISISSKPNHGSVFTLSLPLTLAVLDGIVVSVGDHTFVIPLTAIVETLKPVPSDYFVMGTNSFVIRVRDTFVPLIDVGVEVGIHPVPDFPRQGVAILIETESRHQCALLVDRIQDQRQVVIKGLETNYQHVDRIAAATILGDGRVALILDVEGLVKDRATPIAHHDTLLAKAS